MPSEIYQNKLIPTRVKAMFFVSTQAYFFVLNQSLSLVLNKAILFMLHQGWFIF